jgi:hypothetical protein
LPQKKAIKSGTSRAKAAPWAGNPAAFAVFQYPVLAVPLQAERRFGYELARIAALHNQCDVTAGVIRGTL